MITLSNWREKMGENRHCRTLDSLVEWCTRLARLWNMRTSPWRKVTVAAMVLGVPSLVNLSGTPSDLIAESTPTEEARSPTIGHPKPPTASHPGSTSEGLPPKVAGLTPVPRPTTDTTKRDAVASVRHAPVSRKTVKRAGQQILGQGSYSMECGRNNGIRLFDMDPGEPLGAIGFKNGDRVDSLNDHNVEYAISADTRQMLNRELLKSDELVFSLNRRGRDLTLVVPVQDAVDGRGENP